MAGQSINDRLTAARYSLAGQGLAKSVCKATTEEVIGPKKKHLDYLLHCTNEPNVSIPQLANLLIERSQMQTWVIVFKALITVHHLMCYGNERFTQYLASSNCNFNLGGFLDKTGNTDQPQLSYDMSTFIRRYAKYINEKAISYRTVAFDFCKVKRGKEDGTLRTMPTDTLLKTLPVLQAQLDALLDFDCTSSELSNGVINSAFMLLFRDLIRLFACYNDGIINLLEKYFEMNRKQARDALDCYKKFLIRMDRVSEFLKVAEAVGMDKSEIPDLKQAPSSLLDALEAHLASLEGKKVPTSAPSASSSRVNIKSAVSVLSSTSASFGFASSNGRIGETASATSTTNGTAAGPPIDEVTKRALLAEEEAMYEKLKSQNSQADHKNNPFLSSPTSETSAPAAKNGDTSQMLDLFGGPSQTDSTAPAAASQSKASDDLLQLAAVNPFADMLSSTGAPAASAPGAAAPYTNGFTTATVPTSGFVSDNTFDAVFGNTSSPSQNVNLSQQSWMSVDGTKFAQTQQIKAFDGFGDVLKPEGSIANAPGMAGMGNPATSAAPAASASGPQKLISGDLDMSLSSLVDNLNIKGPVQKPQWNSPKTQSKTGGAGWTPSVPTSTTGGYRPPGPGSIAGQPPAGQWAPGMQPMAGGAPAAGMPGFPAQAGQPAPAQPGAPPTTAAFDPFGAL